MTKNELLEIVVEPSDYKALPLLSRTIRHKWQYSHYLHGAVAYEAGSVAKRPEPQCRSVAAGLELGWAAILVLDDIVDNDSVRYHAPSAWAESGYGSASINMTIGLLEAVRLFDKVEQSLFLDSCINTISAMKEVCHLPMDAGLSEAEPLFRKLGALSCFAVAWPWPEDPALWHVAGYETCMGQLVNDCNDCFGQKAARRGYPDIRNQQASLLTAILHDRYKVSVGAELINSLQASSCEMIAKQMFSIVHKNPEPLFKVFEYWSDHARLLAEKANCSESLTWTKQRIKMNTCNWKNKLLQLLKIGKE